MSDVPYSKKLEGAWLAIQAIKDDPGFWEEFEGIWAELRDTLEPEDDESAALEALVAYAKDVGQDVGDGWV